MNGSPGSQERARGAARGRRRAASDPPPALAGVLLGVVALLFGVLFLIEAWSWATGGRVAGRARRTEKARSLARAALDEARGVLAADLEGGDPAEGRWLQALDSSPEGAVHWLPAPRAAASLRGAGMELRDGGVRLVVLEREPVREGRLPWTGSLRLEATVVRGEAVLVRELREIPVRLVRTRLPAALLVAAWTCRDPGRFLDRTGEGRMEALREDVERALRDLALLHDRRVALRPHLEDVRGTLGAYLAAFRHLGAPLENPLPEVDTWLPPRLREEAAAEPSPEALGRARWLRADRPAVDLGRWAGLPETLRAHAGARDAARRAYQEAAGAWEQAVRRAFRASRWETLPGPAELEFRARSTAEELTRALAALEEAGDRWGRVSREMLGRVRELGRDAALLAGVAARDLDRAVEALEPEVWMRQGEVLDPGELGGPALEVRGVRIVDPRGGGPLVLEDRALSGEGVLVVTGDARIGGLRAVSPGVRVTLQVEGALEIRGRVDAVVVSRGPLRMAPDAWVRGALVTLGPADALEVGGWAEWDPGLRPDPRVPVADGAGLRIELLGAPGGP